MYVKHVCMEVVLRRCQPATLSYSITKCISLYVYFKNNTVVAIPQTAWSEGDTNINIYMFFGIIEIIFIIS